MSLYSKHLQSLQHPVLQVAVHRFTDHVLNTQM